MAKAKTSFIICGRLVGKASGWDEHTDHGMLLYDFEPAPGYNGPQGQDVGFDIEYGNIEIFDSAGQVVTSADLLTVLADCRRLTKEELEQVQRENKEIQEMERREETL